MDNPKNQIADKLKDASNVLVTVSANPSVDQLSAAIGLTLLLTKLKKHATAVFSGQVPSTIEFLKPEETIEQNTNSLRDFIIALDKAKADKIRYKVEENMVKIFITPYRTSIGEPDLVFSQGDFNVDIVVGLGVHQKEDLDQAITAHGDPVATHQRCRIDRRADCTQQAEHASQAENQGMHGADHSEKIISIRRRRSRTCVVCCRRSELLRPSCLREFPCSCVRHYRCRRE